MPEAEKLQQRARAEEQRGRWREALDLYRQSIARSPAAAVDPGLWNRIGDLHLRLGQAAPAVDAYEYAALGYEQAGLFDTASAVCRKALRAMPARPDAHRMLARIAVHQGFAADAREHLARYAEEMRRLGRADALREALAEVGAIAPADAEVSRMVGELRVAFGAE